MYPVGESPIPVEIGIENAIPKVLIGRREETEGSSAELTVKGKCSDKSRKSVGCSWIHNWRATATEPTPT
jgi:hypothetical protein